MSDRNACGHTFVCHATPADRCFEYASSQSIAVHVSDHVMTAVRLRQAQDHEGRVHNVQVDGVADDVLQDTSGQSLHTEPHAKHAC